MVHLFSPDVSTFVVKPRTCRSPCKKGDSYLSWDNTTNSKQRRSTERATITSLRPLSPSSSRIKLFKSQTVSCTAASFLSLVWNVWQRTPWSFFHWKNGLCSCHPEIRIWKIKVKIHIFDIFFVALETFLKSISTEIMPLDYPLINCAVFLL